jgi:hypothetical protein
VEEVELENTLGVAPTHSANMERYSDVYPTASYTVIKFIQLGGHQCHSATMNIPRKSLERECNGLMYRRNIVLPGNIIMS